MEVVTLTRQKRVGDPYAYHSIGDTVTASNVDAIWICGPIKVRRKNMNVILEALTTQAALVEIACKRPLALTVSKAMRMIQLVEEADGLLGSMED